MAVAKQLIRMNEGRGVLVEVEVDTARAVQASNLGEVLDVQRGFETVSEFLRDLLLPFVHTWQALSQDVAMSEASVKLSVGITAGGNFFVAKGESSANLEVALKFLPAGKEG